MKTIRIFFISTLLMMSTGLAAQALREMDKGLPGKVRASCFDTSGNFYAVCGGDFTDTLKIFRWDTGSRKWSQFTKLDQYIDGFGFNRHKVTINYLNGAFYLTGVQGSKTNYSDIYKFQSSVWTKVADVRFNSFTYQWAQIISYKFKNKIYYSTNADSFAGVKDSGVTVFDGNTFSKAGIQTPAISMDWESQFADRNDTLFLSTRNAISFLRNGKWTPIYRTNNYIHSMVMNGNDVIITTSPPFVKRLQNWMVKDSFAHQLSTPIMDKVANRIFISEKKYSNLHSQTAYIMNNTYKIFGIFRNQVRDSVEMHFVSNGKNIYVYGNEGFFYNGVDMHNIAEIDLDSLKEIPFDTLVIRVIRDLNKNNIFDSTDIPSRAYVLELNSGEYNLNNANGYIVTYPLDDENPRYQFYKEYILDSCFKSPFTGAVSGKTFNNLNITRDTILLPIWRTWLQNRNVSLKAYAGARARLSTSTPLYINIENVDCDARSANVTLRVDLEPNTVLLSSNPTYTSKTGNTVTFTTTLGAYQSKSFTLMVEYPFGKFTIPEKVKHLAYVSTNISEDTSDNRDSIVQVTSYSYDPNAKYCNPEGIVHKDLKNIRYHIEFQNEGNDDAWRVTVVDTLNLRLPLVAFQMIGSSHPYTVSHKDNIVTWIFDNINLKPKSLDEAGSRGFLVFDAILNGEFRVGDSIRNKASIYFDLNEPIETNFAVVKRQNPQVSLNPLTSMAEILFYPNPFDDHITFDNKSESDNLINVYDSKGALITTHLLEKSKLIQINTENWMPGMYIFSGQNGFRTVFIKI